MPISASLLTAHAKMRAIEQLTRAALPIPRNLIDALSSDSVSVLETAATAYETEYNKIKNELGYLSALTALQFALYLDSHLELNAAPISARNVEQINAKIDDTNHHFQVRAYWEIAKISALALVLVIGLVVIASTLPALLAPAGYLGAALDGPFFALGAIVSGLSGHGLFSAAKKITPTVEEMVSYHPTMGAELG